MSAFDALGAAAAILQIIELAVKLGDKALRVYNSKDGTTKDLEELGETTAEFQVRNGSLIDQCQVSISKDSSQETLLRIAVQCRTTANELAQLINGLRIKGERTAWKSFMVAVKSEHKKDEIKSKQRDLKRWRTECQEQLLKMLRYAY